MQHEDQKSQSGRTQRLQGPLYLLKGITLAGCSTTGANAIVHFGSVGRLQGLFERSKAHPARG